MSKEAVENMNGPDIPLEHGREEEFLPPSSSVSFLHVVGPSTVRQGLTVPVMAQISWLRDIPRGESVPVSIRFGGGKIVPASLRRLNNSHGHLQFRYEAKAQTPLREYLSTLLSEDTSRNHGVLRIEEIEPQVFLFEPLQSARDERVTLSLSTPHFHKCIEAHIGALPEFQELQECLKMVDYDQNHNQAEYNRRIATHLETRGWKNETRILEEIGLRCDFEKNGVWVEVEFGNARVYYQDYIKFLLASRYRGARLGVLLCPTNAFAQLLCDLGQKRATARRTCGGGRRPSYSGMMSFEKAMRELPFLQFLLTNSLVVGGDRHQRQGMSERTSRMTICG
jgi:restriction endonuclease BglII